MEDSDIFQEMYKPGQFNPYTTKIKPLPYIWPDSTTPGEGEPMAVPLWRLAT